MSTLVSCNSSLVHYCNHNHKFPFKCEAVGASSLPIRPQNSSRQSQRPLLRSQPAAIFPRPNLLPFPPVIVTSHPVPSLFPIGCHPAVVWLPRPFLAATAAKLPQLTWLWVPVVVSVSLPFNHLAQTSALLLPR